MRVLECVSRFRLRHGNVPSNAVLESSANYIAEDVFACHYESNLPTVSAKMANELVIGEGATVKDRAQVVGLQTRQFIIDSSVYIKFNAQLSSRLFTTLKEKVENLGLTLHCNDLIELEVSNWLMEQARTIATEQKNLRKKIEGWNRRLLGNYLVLPEPLDGPAIATIAQQTFFSVLTQQFGCSLHNVSTVGLSSIIQRYKWSEPPFQDRKSKEFPDAIIVESMRIWAKENNTLVYLISEDKAMLADAGSTPDLVPIQGLESFLSIVSEGEEPGVIELVNELMVDEDFLNKLIDELDASFADAPFQYFGNELAEAFVEAADFVTYIGADTWAVISVNGEIIEFICAVDFEAILNVRYVGHVEDEEGNRATGLSDIDDLLTARVYVKYDRGSSTILGLEFIGTIGFDDSPEYEEPYTSFY